MGTDAGGIQQPEPTIGRPVGAIERSGKEAPPANASGGIGARTRAGTRAGAQNNADGQPTTGGKKGARAPRAKTSQEGQASTYVEVEAPQVLIGPAGPPPHEDAGKAKRGRPKKAPKIDSKVAARGLMEMVEVFTVAAFGYEAAFSPAEKFMIEDPLARLVERYGAAVGQFSALVDPILLLTGLGMYAIRLDKLVQERRQKAEEEILYRQQAERIKHMQAFDQAFPQAEAPTADDSANGGARPNDTTPASNPTANVGPEIANLVGGIFRD